MEHTEQRRKWHFDRGVSLDALAAFATILGMVFLAWVNINSRMSVVETTVASLAAEALKRSEDARNTAAILNIRLDRMDDKLDRLIERKK